MGYVECIMGIPLDSVWCWETVGLSVTDGMWFIHYLYFPSSFQFYYTIYCPVFLTEVWKKPLHSAQLPDAAHISTVRNNFTDSLNQSLEWELPPNYTEILNLQGAQIYQK